MRYNELGKTGIKISEIGFGAWGIGGAAGDGPNSYGKTDDNISKDALRRAYDEGITFFDTADIYGYGHSEELIGEELRDVRDKIVIATKVGSVEHGGPEDIKDFSIEHIRSAIRESLKRLKTDYIDLYQLHSPDLGVIRNNPDILEVFNEFKKEGLIRDFGISIDNPNDGVAAIEEFGFNSIQVNLNMIDIRAIENGFLELATERGVGVIARTPLAFGFLTGKIESLNFGDQDHRSKWPREQLELWANAYKSFAPIREKLNLTPVQIALLFCVSVPGISSVIPGILAPEEASENASISSLNKLSEEDINLVKKIYSENTFFKK